MLSMKENRKNVSSGDAGEVEMCATIIYIINTRRLSLAVLLPRPSCHWQHSLPLCLFPRGSIVQLKQGGARRSSLHFKDALLALCMQTTRLLGWIWFWFSTAGRSSSSLRWIDSWWFSDAAAVGLLWYYVRAKGIRSLKRERVFPLRRPSRISVCVFRVW